MTEEDTFRRISRTPYVEVMKIINDFVDKGGDCRELGKIFQAHGWTDKELEWARTLEHRRSIEDWVASRNQ